jgi:uncharacterized protein with HEPN domain
MQKYEIAILLQQLFDHSQEAILLIQGRHRADLDSDRILSLALTRLIEMISNTAGRVPIDFRMEYPAISWIQIMNLRKRLIHADDLVDLDLLWYVLFFDLPELVQALDKIFLKLKP